MSELIGNVQAMDVIAVDSQVSQPELCFAICLDTKFAAGAVGAIRSIRKFYSPQEASIIVFLDREDADFAQACMSYSAELHFFLEIESWAMPLVFQEREYQDNVRHAYHPEFKPCEKLSCQESLERGFHRIRHLHPLNVKAYCTGYCLCVREFARVVHLDADAFLLARLDSLFERYSEPETVIGFEDGEDKLDNLEELYGVTKPDTFRPTDYALNGGVVVYLNGPNVRNLARDFMFFTESPYHYTHSGYFADQGILRALVAAHHIQGKINFHLESATNWNPTRFRAENLRYDAERDIWINESNGQQQFLWHSAGGEKLWTGGYRSDSVNAAWRWVGGGYGAAWKNGLEGFVPYWEKVLSDENYNEKLCFTTCLNKGYHLGAMGLIRSIRRLYSADEADILVFIDRDFDDFPTFCKEHQVTLRYFDAIADWVLPLVYEDPEYATNERHFYHPNFRLVRGLEQSMDRASVGFHEIRHLHPLNVKAYCTGYCLCIANYRHVIHIDADAFLLGRVDEIFVEHAEPNTVIAFDDDEDLLPNFEVLFGIQKPRWFQGALYGFNAGIVFYVNGRGVKTLARDFMFYIESCYHYSHAGFFADQGLIHALVAKNEIQGNIRFVLKDGTNWNPTHRRADSLVLDEETGTWINCRNKKPQHIWHAPSKERPWTGEYPSASVNVAWRYIGGEYEIKDWRDVPGFLWSEKAEFIAQTVADYFGDDIEPQAEGQAPDKRQLRILEFGTNHGRTSLAFYTELTKLGFDVHIDTCDLFAPYECYANVTVENAMKYIRQFALEDRILLHKVGENENLAARFAPTKYDFIYIDAAHEYKQVVAECFMAMKLIKNRALIMGDDYDIDKVREAVTDFFGPKWLQVEMNQWIVPVDIKD